MLKTQKGLVLVSSLLYLTIVTLAALAVLESAGILVYSNTNAVLKQQDFYLLETELKKAEREVLNTLFTENNFEEQLNGLGAIDYEQINFRSPLHLARDWDDEEMIKRNYGKAQGVTELLGFRKIIKLENDGQNNIRTYLLIRLSVAIPDKESDKVNFLLQSLLLIPLLEPLEIESGKFESGKRLAWLDISLEE